MTFSRQGLTIQRTDSGATQAARSHWGKYRSLTPHSLPNSRPCRISMPRLRRPQVIYLLLKIHIGFVFVKPKPYIIHGRSTGLCSGRLKSSSTVRSQSQPAGLLQFLLTKWRCIKLLPRPISLLSMRIQQMSANWVWCECAGAEPERLPAPKRLQRHLATAAGCQPKVLAGQHLAPDHQHHHRACCVRRAAAAPSSAPPAWPARSMQGQRQVGTRCVFAATCMTAVVMPQTSCGKTLKPPTRPRPDGQRIPCALRGTTAKHSCTSIS